MNSLANNVALTLLARLASVVGIPVALLVLGWTGGTFLDMRDAVNQLRNDIRLQVETQKIIDANQDRRIMNLEKKP